MTGSSRYDLPFLQAGQAQKEVTHNDAIARVDSLLQIGVESRQTAAVQAVAGAAWIVTENAIGAWAGFDGQIATYDEAGWTFVAPRDGCIAYVRDEDLFVHYSAGQWRDAWPVRSLVVDGQILAGGATTIVSLPTGGTVIDVETRATLGQVVTALRNMGIIAPA